MERYQQYLLYIILKLSSLINSLQNANLLNAYSSQHCILPDACSLHILPIIAFKIGINNEGLFNVLTLFTIQILLRYLDQ